jgi:hypothetical protein
MILLVLDGERDAEGDWGMSPVAAPPERKEAKLCTRSLRFGSGARVQFSLESHGLADKLSRADAVDTVMGLRSEASRCAVESNVSSSKRCMASLRVCGQKTYPPVAAAMWCVE